MVHKLIRLNVERITDDEHIAKVLIDEGFKLVEEKQQSTDLSDEYVGEDTTLVNENQKVVLDTLTMDELKKIATEKGLQIPSKIKKDELIKMIEEVE